MPNWCDFRVTFTGDEAALQALDEAITVPEEERDTEDIFARPDIDLTRPYPTPEELLNTKGNFLKEGDPSFSGYTPEQEKLIEQYGSSHWYNWNIKNWGTKWSPDVTTYDPHGPSILIQGLSAWAQPGKLIEKLTELFGLKAVLTYSEQGFGFGGSEAYCNGEQVFDGFFDFDADPSISGLEAPKSDDQQLWDDYWCRIQDAIEETLQMRELEAMGALETAES